MNTAVKVITVVSAGLGCYLTRVDRYDIRSLFNTVDLVLEIIA